MQGVVPAAGRGSRLRPLTDDRPKALVEVGDRPLLSHVLDALAPHVESYVVVVGYRGEQIRERYGDGYRGRPISYVEQPERLGLADAVARAASVVDGRFLQCNGDNVLRGNLGEVVATLTHETVDAVLLVEEVDRDRARRGGVVVTAGERVVDVVEKPAEPPSRLATTGCYAFEPGILDACRRIEPGERGEYELADAVGALLARGGRVETVRLDGWRVNVNEPADVERAERRL